MRSPRMQGTPPIWSGFTVIRSYAIRSPLPFPALCNPEVYHSYSSSVGARAILQRLGQMWRGDGLRSSQIGDGTRQFEDAVEGAQRVAVAASPRARAVAPLARPRNTRVLRQDHLGVTGHSWRRGEATRLDRPRRP